jgi:hypothetical protein
MTAAASQVDPKAGFNHQNAFKTDSRSLFALACRFHTIIVCGKRSIAQLRPEGLVASVQRVLNFKSGSPA